MDPKTPDKENYNDFGESSDLQSDLINSTPRAAGIVGATAIEIYLERLLNSFLIHDTRKVNIRTFTLKIDLCYNLGLISKDEYDDLHRVREIRNAFANDFESYTFEDDYIKKICTDFAVIKKLKGNEDLPVRMKYNALIYTLEYILKQRIDEASKEKRKSRVEFVFNS